jgi:hypothetical protein
VLREAEKWLDKPEPTTTSKRLKWATAIIDAMDVLSRRG